MSQELTMEEVEFVSGGVLPIMEAAQDQPDLTQPVNTLSSDFGGVIYDVSLGTFMNII